MGDRVEEVTWDEFALAFPAVARTRSYKALLANVQGDGEWAEWPPVPDGEAALAATKNLLPAGVDAKVWFTRIDWAELAARVPDEAKGAAGNQPGEFVAWLVGEGRTKPEAAALFEIMSSLNPITFGRVLAEGLKNPLVRQVVAGQVCARLLTQKGVEWLVQTMAIASEVADQLNAQARPEGN